MSPLRLALLLGLGTGCLVFEPGAEGGAEAQHDAIIGGTPTTGDLAVFMLEITGDTGANTRCSATLIAPRTLLTAAHCVDPTMLGANRLTIVASNAPTAAQMITGVNTVRVVETRLHPRWNAAAGLSDDLALCLLENEQSIPVSAWNSTDLTGLGGEPVRVVGYGADAPDAGTGTKRAAQLTIRQLSAELISLGNFVDRGICHGDSGGPTFHTFDDGVERLIGVHSFTRTAACVDGADTRVDAKADFLLQWLSEKEDNCAPNFICAASACATADPDCLMVGAACTAAWDCPSRACVSDAQHPAPYCSKACSTQGDCPLGMSCDVSRQVCQRLQLPASRPGAPCVPAASFCASGSICNGRSVPEARCSQPCTRANECLPGQVCEGGFSGVGVCLDPPPVRLPVGRVELPAARCSTAFGIWPALGMLWFARRRQHRSSST